MADKQEPPRKVVKLCTCPLDSNVTVRNKTLTTTKTIHWMERNTMDMWEVLGTMNHERNQRRERGHVTSPDTFNNPSFLNKRCELV